MSLDSIEEALAEWDQTPITQTTVQATEWLARALAIILRRRPHSREMGLSYYRLTRALRTGSTIADSRREEQKYVSLDQLRREFDLLINGEVESLEDIPVETEAQAAKDPDSVLVERLFDIKKMSDDLDALAEEAASRSLATTGPEALQRAQARLDDSMPARDMESKRAETHTSAGVTQAGAVQRHTANGGRGMVSSLAKADRLAIGFVRVSTTGTPCGFCAMLISRGPIEKRNGGTGGFFLSAESAGGRLDANGVRYGGDEYHDNCQCVAEPVFSLSQYNSDPLYDLNRLYAKQWPEVTEGLRGRDALNAWRSFIRKQAELTPTVPAQAA